MNSLGIDLALRRAEFDLRAHFVLPARGIIGVFGHSGSGKTTLLRCIAGLERARGTMRIGNEIWQDEARGIFRDVRTRGVGYVFQEPRLFPHLSVRGNLRYGYTRTPPAQRRVVWEQAVEVLGLEALLDRRVHQLSLGEQQRVSIGRALLSSPQLLLMDEPVAALDVKRKRDVLPFIRRAAIEFDIPMLFVSHNLQEMLQLADTMVLLDQGRVCASGALNEVLTRLDTLGYFGDTGGAVLDARVTAHEPEYALTHLEVHQHKLVIPQRAVEIGATLRVFILARNVSIALEPVLTPFSVLNVLEASVVEVGACDARRATVDVKLDIGVPLLASITRKSLEKLQLRVGQHVYAYVKAVSLEQEL